MRLSTLGRAETRGAAVVGIRSARAHSLANLVQTPMGTYLTSNQTPSPAINRRSVSVSASAVADAPSTSSNGSKPSEPFRVVIAGAGIGGLVLAVGLLKQGFDVKILERDFTAIRGEGKYRGPIQIQSNALAALEALDTSVADKILAEGCITGDRVNGLCDGLTGEWYCKFDTFHPAVEKGLPVTRVISRFTLQEILADKVLEIGGPDIIINDCQLVDFIQEKDPATGKQVVHAVTDDGRRFTGDLLVGADGIHSKVHQSFFKFIMYILVFGGI